MTHDHSPCSLIPNTPVTDANTWSTLSTHSNITLTYDNWSSPASALNLSAEFGGAIDQLPNASVHVHTALAVHPLSLLLYASSAVSSAEIYHNKFFQTNTAY